MVDEVSMEEAKKPPTICTDSPDEIVTALTFVLIRFQERGAPIIQRLIQKGPK